MKKFLALLLLLGVCSLPLGCGSSTPSSPSSGGSTSLNFSFLASFGFYWGTCCTPQAGGFGDITGVAVSGNYVFVGDDYFHAIQVFDTQGSFITWFYPYNSYYGDYVQPEGMSADNHGHLFVADPYNYAIDVYNISSIFDQAATVTGNYIYNDAMYWTDCGSPQDVAVDSKGNMYVSDNGCGAEIYEIAPDFNWSTEPNIGDDIINGSSSGSAGINGGALAYVGGIAVDPNGSHIYVADETDNVIETYDNNFTWKSVIGDSAGASSTFTGKFDYPWGVREDTQGNLVIADQDNARVQRVGPSGSVLNVIGSSVTVSGGLYSPYYVAVDSNNNIYVTDNTQATVMKYASH